MKRKGTDFFTDPIGDRTLARVERLHGLVARNRHRIVEQRVYSVTSEILPQPSPLRRTNREQMVDVARIELARNHDRRVFQSFAVGAGGWRAAPGARRVE